jgi:thioredoxin reductase (NADPH)
MYDLIIIGSGPAGLTAGIYAERAGLKALVLERNFMSGGQIIDTYEIDNYPGLMGINGFDLAQKMREHADQLGVAFKMAEVQQVEDLGDTKKVHTSEETLLTKTVLFATGAHHSSLNIPGEAEYAGKGVSYCATCDGAFYKNKDVAVIGGGNVAIEDAIFLARTCRKVYVVHRRDQLRAQKALQDKLFEFDNVEMVWHHTPVKIVGEDGKTSGLLVHDKSIGTDKCLEVSGVFVAVGIVPNSKGYEHICACDQKGYIVAGEDCRTSAPGFFAAGDVRTKEVRQVATAVGDGANAIASVERYLNTRKW